jgi:hypothetical protein
VLALAAMHEPLSGGYDSVTWSRFGAIFRDAIDRCGSERVRIAVGGALRTKWGDETSAASMASVVRHVGDVLEKMAINMIRTGTDLEDHEEAGDAKRGRSAPADGAKASCEDDELVAFTLH